MTDLAFTSGPTNSPPLALVGEAWGKDEAAAKRPFVGAAGRLLDLMLRNAGIRRDECFVTNVVHERPPANDFGHYYEDKKKKVGKPELYQHRKRLHEELRQVRPKVIVPMGGEALKSLVVEQSSITKCRGSLFVQPNGWRILPTLHPAYVLRMFHEKVIVELDLKKAYRQALHPSTPNVEFNVSPSLNEILDLLNNCPSPITLDLETLDLYTRCIGIAWSPTDALSIPMINTSQGESAWHEHEEALILEALNKVLLNPSIEKILQNFPFDSTVLARELGMHIEGIRLDTMFGFHLLYPELPKGLSFLSSIYTDFPMYWDYDSKNDKSTMEYNCYDCCVTYQVAEHIEQELSERGMLDFYHGLVQPVTGTLTRMQNRGVKIDLEARGEIERKTEGEMNQTLKELQELTHEGFNPSSSKQVKELVYDTMGLPRQFKPRTRTVTADGDALAILARKYPTYEPVLSRIITYREKRTLLGTFVRAKVTEDGRIKTSYNVAGTVTGRISSSATIDGYGGNLQNIPRGEFRRIYVADPGKILIKADLAQAEYRVLIWKARIRRLIERFLNDPNFSIHYWNATNIFGVAREEVTKQMYDDAKNGVYGANYGIGALKVSRMYNMDFQRSKYIIQSYHRHVPEVQGVYQREIREEVLTTKKVTNPFKRERVFLGRVDDDLFRKAYSHYCQSTVGDLINSALVDLDAEENSPVELLLQVHDEIVAQAPKHQIDEACLRIKKAMERPLLFKGVEEPLVIPAEIKTGPNWFDLEKWKKA